MTQIRYNTGDLITLVTTAPGSSTYQSATGNLINLPLEKKCHGACEAQKNLPSKIKILLLAVIQLLLLSACLRPRPAEIPMAFEFFSTGSSSTDELIVFLPGRGDDIDAFQRAGFIDMLMESDRPLDAVVADAHLGYYYQGVLADRVHQDILLPFQQKGYKRFIIVGSSLGGYGSLWINHEYKDLIPGIVLLAPYLGKKSVINEIESAGSLNAWRSQLEGEPTPDDKVWLWIADLANRETPETPSVIVATGKKDKFSESAGLLSRSLPDSRLFLNNGGHDWKTWSALWAEILTSPEWKKLVYIE